MSPLVLVVPARLAGWTERRMYMQRGLDLLLQEHERNNGKDIAP